MFNKGMAVKVSVVGKSSLLFSFLEILIDTLSNNQPFSACLELEYEAAFNLTNFAYVIKI